MSSISFDNVWLLLIAVPIIVLCTIPFALAIRKENANGHNITSHVLHVVLAILIAFAAAGTSITRIMTETDVFVVADVSFSANKNLTTLDSYIENLVLPRNCQLGLVCFGKDFELVGGLDDPENVPSVRDARVDDSETDIVSALAYAGTLFEKEDAIKRIVLITDGKETDQSDSYAVKRVVDGLEAQGIKVDAIFLDDNISPNAKEVQISSVDFTKTAYRNHEEIANVRVQSTHSTTAILELYRDGVLVDQQAAELSIGSNLVPFTLDTSKSATYEYEVDIVTIDGSDDENAFNNKYLFTQKVVEDLKVLIISQKWQDVTALVDRYGADAAIDVYENDTSARIADKRTYINSLGANSNLSATVTDSKITINTLTTEVPYSIEDFSKYDEIVLADVDITTLTNYTEFITSLDAAVSQFGKSLLTIGNLGIQSRGDEEFKALEDMLPVRYGNSANDPKLYTLVIDTSRSMEFLFHLTIAKVVATKLVGILNPADEMCIIAFHGEARVILPPTPLTDPASVIEDIQSLDVIQGTLIGNGLKEAYRHIVDLNYSDKQVMLLSDGLTYSDETEDAIEIAREMYEDGIVTSVFDVGRQGDSNAGTGANPDPVASAAKLLLQNIAREGHGNYFYSNNQENLPDAFFADMADKITESIIEGRETTVNVNRRTDDVLEGIDTTGGVLPNITGYVYSGTKASATTVLTVNHVRANSTVQRPLYAYWKYGNGKVSTFTSSFVTSWAGSWAASEDMTTTFVDNLLETNIPTEQTDVPYRFTLTEYGRSARIDVAAVQAHLGTTATAEISFPSGTVLSMDLISSDSRTFFGEFDTLETGRYSVSVTYVYNKVEYTTTTALDISYTAEYDSFATYEPSVLHKAIDGRGTVSRDGTLSLLNSDEEVGKFVYELTVPLLIACVVLFVVDIIVRKLKWDDIKSFFGGSKNKKNKEVKK